MPWLCSERGRSVHAAWCWCWAHEAGEREANGEMVMLCNGEDAWLVCRRVASRAQTDRLVHHLFLICLNGQRQGTENSKARAKTSGPCQRTDTLRQHVGCLERLWLCSQRRRLADEPAARASHLLAPFLLLILLRLRLLVSRLLHRAGDKDTPAGEARHRHRRRCQCQPERGGDPHRQPARSKGARTGASRPRPRRHLQGEGCSRSHTDLQ